MSAIALVIKKEPEEAPQMQSEDVPTYHSESSTNQTEFVNIKTEIELEPPSVSVKVEPLENGPSSPQEFNTPQMQSYPAQTQNWQATDIKPMYWHNAHIPTEDVQLSSPMLVEKPELWHRPVTIDPVKIDVKCVPIEYDRDNGLKDAELKSDAKKTKGETQKWISTPDGKFACTICSKTYSTPGNFQRHFLVHSLGPLECQHCGKSFTTAPQLQRHVKVHGTYNCDECGKVFRSSSNLFQHKRVHMSEKPFKCPLCGKQFTVRANLMKHQGKSRCKTYTGPITCHVCHKIFKTEFLLKSHLRRHTTEKPFSCDLCEMNFKYKSTLIRHIQIHNGVRPYACEVCNKSFTHFSLLKPHMRIHTGEKPYPCPVCSKQFAHKHNMERHALRHNREKITVCEICHKQFPKESRLKYHMRTHIAEKHFRCYVCPKKFSHRQNVLRHYVRKHPHATYDCPDTDAKIATKLWQDHLEKKLQLIDKNGDKNAVQNKDGANNATVSESEAILPDVDLSVGEGKKKKLTTIVAALNKRIAQKCNENGDSDTVAVKKEFSDEFDSDDEALASKVNRNCETILIEITKHNENVDGNERVVGCNESVNNGNEIITHSNVSITFKREVVSDEEILPDREEDILLTEAEIKKEHELGIEY